MNEAETFCLSIERRPSQRNEVRAFFPGPGIYGNWMQDADGALKSLWEKLRADAMEERVRGEKVLEKLGEGVPGE